MDLRATMAGVASGALVASDWDGRVLVTDTGLKESFIFDASPGISDGAFISFSTYVPTPGAILVLWVGASCSDAVAVS